MVATSFPWKSLATGCQLDMPGCGGRESKPASSAVRLTAILSARFAYTSGECNPDASRIVRLTAAPSRPRPTRRGLRSHGGASPPRQSTARGALSAQRAFLWPSLKRDSSALRPCNQTQRQGAALTREQHVAINLVLPELLHDSGPFLPALRLGPSLHFLHLPVAHRRGLVCRLGGGFGRQR